MTLAAMTLVNFWWLLLMAVLAWYATVTVYVAVRGSLDVKHMLDALKRKREADDAESARAPAPPSRWDC